VLKVNRALISVSEKKGLLGFAKGLHALGVEIVSTGGTARKLKESGVPKMFRPINWITLIDVVWPYSYF